MNPRLLVDEIDTGLHYTVVEKMWKMVAETAQKLNIQVFATTHSYDCISGLARYCRDAGGAGVSLHRIDKDAEASVVFSENELMVAADRDIEVR